MLRGDARTAEKLPGSMPAINTEKGTNQHAAKIPKHGGVFHGSEIPQYSIFGQAGDPGLQNVSGLFGNGTGFEIDLAGQSATFIGAMPASALLRDAILGVILNSQSILNAAKFTVTNPAPAGETLWTGGELITPAGQAQPLILPATSTNVPIGPPYICTPVRRPATVSAMVESRFLRLPT